MASCGSLYTYLALALASDISLLAQKAAPGHGVAVLGMGDWW